MIGPSRRGCGQNAGEVATATVRGTACCSEPPPHAAAVADSLVTEDGHGSVARRPDDAPRFDSVRPAPWRRTSDRPTDRHRRHWGAARGPPVNQQTSPSGAKVVPRARAALARTQETTSAAAVVQHACEARWEHGDPIQVYSRAGSLAAGQGRVAARQQSGQTDVDRAPLRSPPHSGLSGTLETGLPPRGGRRDPKSERPSDTPNRSPASDKPVSKILKNTTRSKGGAGGTPGSRFGSRVTFPTEARVRTTSPALRRASPGSPIAFPSSPVLPFFPPNTIENTKRERNRILLGLKEKNTSENFLSCLHKTGASLALCVKILQIFNSNVFGSLARGEA